jgi:hypothetical protein
VAFSAGGDGGGEPSDICSTARWVAYFAYAAPLARAPAALGACSVAMIDLHSAQTMSAASWSFLSFAFITSKIIGWVLLQVGHQTWKAGWYVHVLAPILFRFPLHRRCRRVLAFDPVPRAAGAVGQAARSFALH